MLIVLSRFSPIGHISKMSLETSDVLPWWWPTMSNTYNSIFVLNNQGWIQVLWGLELVQFLEQSLKKYKITNKKLGMKLNIYFGPLGKWGTLKIMLHKLHDKSAPVDNKLCTVLCFCKITYESAWWMNHHQFKLEKMQSSQACYSRNTCNWYVH